MLNIQHLELPVLLDLLVSQTSLFTKMLTAGYKDDDLKNCQKIIEELQSEIEERTGSPEHTLEIRRS